MFRLKDTLDSLKYFNARGVAASISYLPRIKNRPEEIAKEVEEYVKVLEIISEKNLNSDVTIKLQQFGILKKPALTLQSLTDLAAHAENLKKFIWIDMERSSTVTPTIEIFEKLNDRFGNVGICLQAYLRRTKDDLANLLKRRAPIRLVKGFYNDNDIKN